MWTAYRNQLETRRRSGEMFPPVKALRWPVYLLWWSYVFVLAMSPLPVLAQDTTDVNGFLPNGCQWDEQARELKCSALGLTHIPYIHPNISGKMKQLNLVNNSLETLTIEDIKNFTEVTLLDLRSNKIRVIDDKVFSARYLPKLQQLFLARNQLTRLPLNVFQFTVFITLDLSYNNFKQPPPALSNTNQIATLLLHNNPFDGLQKDSLANISSLLTLELSACNLTSENLHPEVFHGFKSLRTLYLDLNHFPYLRRKMFASIPSVRDLHMQHCGIENIEKRAFKDLESLNGLYLSRNNISELVQNSFRDLIMKTLDLSYCGIQNIKKGAMRTRITNKLYLSHNNITVIHDKDFKELQGVKYIDLSYSNIAEIRGSPFVALDYLEELHLQHNSLDDVSVGALNTTGRLSYLDLTGNRLTAIPDLNGRHFPYLQQLEIGENSIAYISNRHLRNMSSLYVLILKHNPIEEIENEAFMECWRVTDLNMDYTRIKRLPDMSNMSKLTDLHMVHSSLEYFPDDFCTTNPRLIIIEATANNIRRFTNFSGCHGLFSLALDHNEIAEIPEGVLNELTKLDILKLHENRIRSVAPGVFNDLRILKTLTLYHNEIEDLPEGIFSQLTALRKLNLGFNRIRKLPGGVFANNTLLSSLWLNDNDIREVHPTAFVRMPYLITLNMSSNYFCSLNIPDSGFPSLRVLGLEQLWCLHNVPNPHTMPNAQEIYYTYAYHCCLWEDTLNSGVYDNDTAMPTTVPPHATGEVTFPTEVVPLGPEDPFENDCTSEGASPERESDLLDIARLYNLTIVWGPDCTFTIEAPASIGLTPEDILNFQNGQPTKVLNEDENNVIIGTESEGFFDGVNQFRNHHPPDTVYIPWKEVTCFPRPNPLTPCDNLLDPWPIRVAIWAVWVLTLLGNIAVLFIMIAARQKMDVSQFFICVLAFSNTLLGIYLAFIAMVDIRTLGDRSFYQSALDWQKGSGCQTAGFLAIFSSQLSVYILVILTIERLHHVITSILSPHPKGSKKLHLAVVLIIVGIVYACILAVLPLNGMGVNAYDEVAICLPFVTTTPKDRNYILAILSLNMMGILIVVFGFLIVFGCLLRPSLSRKKRWEVFISATKLSLLMVTTFLCWFPIGIVGYSSVLQEPIINAEQAKYFIVFVFPINALLSPIIYALITRSFRRNIWWIVTCCPNANKKDKPSQPFRLIPRQTTSTPTSMISSDIPHGQSPRSLNGEELRVLRQSRRSNSYSVQFNPNISNQQCPTPPTPGSMSRMGRRASLPAVFDSNITERHLNDDSASPQQPVAFPFRLAPGLLSQLNSSLPNLPEENETEERDVIPENQAIFSSPHEQLVRKLSTVPECDETDVGFALKDSVHVMGVRRHSKEGDVSDNESVEFVDAEDTHIASPTISCIHPQNTSDKSSTVTSVSFHNGLTPTSLTGCEDMTLPSATDTLMQDNTPDTSMFISHLSMMDTQEEDLEMTSFEYSKLNEQSYCEQRSSRLEIVNPRFAALSPTQGSETDV